jgi:hypothetical protein
MAKKSAKKAKKAVKKGGVQAAMMTVKIPKGTAKDPHPPIDIPVPGGQSIHCEWSDEANKYICE